MVALGGGEVGWGGEDAFVGVVVLEAGVGRGIDTEVGLADGMDVGCEGGNVGVLEGRALRAGVEGGGEGGVVLWSRLL